MTGARNSRVGIKFCGLTRAEDVEAASRLGAVFAGFVFFPGSPRNLNIDDARALAQACAPGIHRVGLVVDASDELIDHVCAHVPLDYLQLHGRESPARVAQIARRSGLPMIKSIAVAAVEDLDGAATYAGVAEMVLLDAKPPLESTQPGGLGIPFDWTLVAEHPPPLPWMLAGGLNAENIVEAVGISGASMVDVSSGVERLPGIKDQGRMADFVAALECASNRNTPVPAMQGGNQ